MTYINLDIDCLFYEITSLMENNYNGDVTKENFEEKFILAKRDILETIESIIEENKNDVLFEFNFE